MLMLSMYVILFLVNAYWKMKEEKRMKQKKKRVVESQEHTRNQLGKLGLLCVKKR